MQIEKVDERVNHSNSNIHHYRSIDANEEMAKTER
jgi:hypothetical protein